MRAARRLARRAVREQTGQFLVEGPQAVREAAEAGLLTDVFVTEGAAPWLADLRGAAVHVVTDAALATLAETVTPQGVVAVCRSPLVPTAAALAGAPRLVAVLADVRDPGNAGTVVRCADAAGADAVLLSAGSVDPLNGKCVRAAAGSLFHLPVSAGDALPDLLAAVRVAGCQVLATASDGAVDLDDAVDTGLLAAPTAWVLGNEARGLPAAATALADHVVRIPIHGRAESLNLAAAAAVCLYASARAQRRG